MLAISNETVGTKLGDIPTLVVVPENIGTYEPRAVDGAYEICTSVIVARDVFDELLSESHQTMIASQAILALDWNDPQEARAWANL